MKTIKLFLIAIVCCGMLIGLFFLVNEGKKNQRREERREAFQETQSLERKVDELEKKLEQLKGQQQSEGEKPLLDSSETQRKVQKVTSPVARKQSESSQEKKVRKGKQAPDLYREGVAYYEKEDYKEAYQHFSEAEKLGEKSSFGYLGLMYELGEYVAKDTEKAKSYYELAENGWWKYRLGCLYYKEKEYKKAFQAFSLATNCNRADDVYLKLGEMYERGKGVEVSILKAVENYRLSALHAFIDYDACLALKKLGCTVLDEVKLEELAWEKRRGKTPGQLYKTADDYIGSHPKKLYEGYAYLKAAAEAGHPAAQYKYAEWLQHGKYIRKDYKKAMDWYLKAADQGLVKAYNAIGGMYLGGEGVNKSNKKAIVWYRKAADEGDEGGQLWLGQIYEKKKQYKTALDWYTKAAEQGQGWAQYLLGKMYEEGRGTTRDVDKAVDWYKKSVDSKNYYGEYAKKALQQLNINY